ncbi:amidase [Nocardioides scoriae]|uniref:Amidase n=1 Tax=Nocardioides scoriae TaxID=642780 RepID=A0A1H1VAK0_9ACTN|nr:amidase [Nocardioides scoriae]SDS81511.1 amidase [Nocardioides scoriae]
MSLADLSATSLSGAVGRREVSCVEVVADHLERIDALDPLVNAVVSRRPSEVLLAEAAQADTELARGEHRGWLHGLPVAVKDLNDVRGLPTSRGFFRDAPPAAHDSLVAARMRAVGAIVVGKTNTPEFGLGSHTYNAVFGTTLNAWDQSRTAGGSSGGAAVAVALRMLPVADGSDFFGSLRNPTGWNNVYGLRPSLGRVPHVGDELWLSQGGVDGPVARTAADLAALFGTLAGPDVRDPLSTGPARGPRGDLAELVAPDLTGQRVGWLGDLGGYLPVEPEVMRVCERALHGFEDLGMEVLPRALPAHGRFRGPDDLWSAWLPWRHLLAGSALEPVHAVPALRARMKPEARYEVEGLLGHDGQPPLSAAAVMASSRLRSDLYRAVLSLFDDVDHLVLPTAQVMPFDAALDWPREVAGRAMSSYHRWMEVCALGTLVGAPVLALPAGFSADGLPMGLQVIGRPRDDEALLGLAAAWETVTDHHRALPPLLRGLTGGTS